ncbi:MAG: glycosyltransferase family 39 protein [Chloroflexota bacterium]
MSTVESTFESQNVQPRVWPWLTVETALYTLLGLLALISRLAALGHHPLAAPEAEQALYAWQSISGSGGQALVASPLLFGGQTLIFALLGASDSTARLLPALAGVVLVLLPYLLRHRLGRLGALAASTLLLISPTALFTSRYASGDILLLTAGLATLAGWVGWVDRRRPAHLYLMAVSAALAVVSAPGVFTLILALIAALVSLRLLGLRAFEDGGWVVFRDAWREMLRQPRLVVLCAALFFGVWLLLPTALLLHLEAVQSVADLFPAWVNHLAPWAGDQPWGYALAVLALQEPLTLVFGLAGAGLAFRWRDWPGQLLAVWAGVALVLALLAGGRGAGDVLLVVGPLALLGGKATGAFFENTIGQMRWSQDGLVVGLSVVVAAFFFLQLATYGLRRESNYLWLAVLALGLGVGLFALYTAWFGRLAGWRGGGLAVLLLLGLVTLSCAMNLAYHRSHDPRELLVVEATSPNVRDLAAVLEQTSMQRLGATEIIPITVEETVGPVVRWYLRSFRYQTWLSQPVYTAVTSEAVILPWKSWTPELGAAYFGGDFVVRTTWQPQNLAWADWVNWLIYRTSPDQLHRENVVLWLKQQE